MPQALHRVRGPPGPLRHCGLYCAPQLLQAILRDCAALPASALSLDQGPLTDCTVLTQVRPFYGRRMGAYRSPLQTQHKAVHMLACNEKCFALGLAFLSWAFAPEHCVLAGDGVDARAILRRHLRRSKASVAWFWQILQSQGTLSGHGGHLLISMNVGPACKLRSHTLYKPMFLRHT